jgi:hypothetical protein
MGNLGMARLGILNLLNNESSIIIRFAKFSVI